MIVVSVLPRMSPVGSSALIGLDARTLQPVAVRRFKPTEYLQSADRAAPIEHCRGLAAWGTGGLAVGMFNSVQLYDIVDASCLTLRPSRRLDHPLAVDIHGISSRGNYLHAASTGGETVITWSTTDARTWARPLSEDYSGDDLRFPLTRARDADVRDWRRVLPTTRHINDVVELPNGDVVVCSLRSILKFGASNVDELLVDQRALFHDGRCGPDGHLLFTNAAAGQLLVLDPDTLDIQRVRVADPERWFVRGLAVVDGGGVFVLRSERGETRQRTFISKTTQGANTGGKFGISFVDLASRSIVQDTVVRSDDLDGGVVAYTAVLVETKPDAP